MTAYLTDGHHLQFFRVNKRVDSLLPLSYFESQFFDLEQSGSLAMRWFWGLMTTRLQDLGWALPVASVDGKQLTLTRFLGSGTCM